MVAENPKKYSNYYTCLTSGSTGMPLKIYRTWFESAYMIAKFLRVMLLNGMKLTDRIFSICSPVRKVKRDSVIQSLCVLNRRSSTYFESPQEKVKTLIDAKADIIYGNRSFLEQMAIYILENDIRIKRPKLCISAGETMDPHSKKILTDCFGPGLIEIYGAVEFNNLAFQNVGDERFTINHDTNFLEIFEQSSYSGVEGNILVTDLNIFSFPLIRYRLQDRIKLAPSRGLEMIDKIRGKEDDWIVLKNGTKIPFHVVNIIMYEFFDWVLYYRFIQTSEQELKIEIVSKNDYAEQNVSQRIRKRLWEKVSPELDIDIDLRDYIPPDESGKLRKVISLVKSI
jgi:phenylacetate-CoA ligase